MPLPVKSRIEELIRSLGLLDHPEGGYYRETYRSKGKIGAKELSPAFRGDRNYSTAIYFLLTSDNFSAFHRIRQDEVWHFYEGSNIVLHLLKPDGSYEKVILGPDISKGHHFQCVVEAGTWFASEVAEPNSYSLAGCTVAPGFDFEDFEMAKAPELLVQYPAFKDLTTRLCRS